MRLPSDFSTAKGYTGAEPVTPLALGGHICRIRGARLEKCSNGMDRLVLAFDIQEGSEWDGYYAQKYQSLRNWSADSKWPGVFSTFITNPDGKTSGYFKGLIESIEKSNPGFDFVAAGADENKLNGKMVGFNFGEEEYWSSVYSEVRVIVKPRYAVSVQDVRDGVEPPKLKKMKPEKLKQLQEQSNITSSAGSYAAEDDPDDLPF